MNIRVKFQAGTTYRGVHVAAGDVADVHVDVFNSILGPNGQAVVVDPATPVTVELETPREDQPVPDAGKKPDTTPPGDGAPPVKDKKPRAPRTKKQQQ